MTRARNTSRLVSDDVFTLSGSPTNVGVGSTGPSSKLNVDGTISASGLNITGVVTSTQLDISGSVTATESVTATDLNISGVSTLGNVQITAGIVTAVSGIITYYGDGSGLSGVAGVGLGTALSEDETSPLSNVFYTNKTLGIAQTTIITVPDSSNVAYTHYAELAISNDSDIIISDGDDFIIDVLGISTNVGPGGPLSGGGNIRVDNITDRSGSAAPIFPYGWISSGIVTTTGMVSSGVVTATNFSGDGAGLTGRLSRPVLYFISS